VLNSKRTNGAKKPGPFAATVFRWGKKASGSLLAFTA